MSAPTPRRGSSAPIDSYPVRVMLGLVISLSVLLAIVHLPMGSSSLRVGWSAQPFTEQIILDEVRAEQSEKPKETVSESEEPASVPPTGDRWTPQSKTASTTVPEASSPTPSDTSSTSGLNAGPDQYEKVQSVTELGITDRTPHISGGPGSLYLHIKYPPKAIEKGIEGKLTLEFMVERDGSIRDVQVVDSLHPLCDSAAVAGLQQVDFVPAKKNGEPIPIRLALPIRFQLTTHTSPTLSNERSP